MDQAEEHQQSIDSALLSAAGYADPLADRELALLEEIRNGQRNLFSTLAVSNKVAGPAILDDFPLNGFKRLLVPREPGGATLTVGEAGATVLVHNPSRLGCSIVNSGAKAARLFFAPLGNVQAGSAGLGRLWLAGEGGSWDGRISQMPWLGSVSAQAIGGETTLETCEV